MRVCLIHGSTQNPQGWDLVVKELMAWGAQVTAVDLPSVPEGAEFFAREVVRQMPAGEPPVVVAHSAAGMILPLVPEFMKVARLVYVAAIIPEPGVSLLQQFKSSPANFQLDWVGKDPTKDPVLARHFLFHDCEERVQQWALTTLRLWASRTLTGEPCPLRRMPRVQTTYVSATLDRAINPSWWERCAETKLRVKPVRVEAGHAPHVSRPREVARILGRH